MNRTTPVCARNRATPLVAFLLLSLLPCLMNAFPRTFAHAFSEQTGNWTFTSLLLMGVVITAWCVAALRVGRALQRPPWQDLRTLGQRPRLARVLAAFERFGTSIAMWHGAILIALFYLMWFSARLSLGRWPRWGGADDPKGIAGTALIHLAIWIWFLLAPVAVALPLFRAGAAEARNDSTAAEPVRQFVITVLLQAAAFGFVITNPHHLITWFLD